MLKGHEVYLNIQMQLNASQISLELVKRENYLDCKNPQSNTSDERTLSLCVSVSLSQSTSVYRTFLQCI